MCRNEKSQRGYITWTINLPSRYLITSVMVAVKSKTYEQGVVNWLLTSEKLCDKILPGLFVNFIQTALYQTPLIILVLLRRQNCLCFFFEINTSNV